MFDFDILSDREEFYVEFVWNGIVELWLDGIVALVVFVAGWVVFYIVLVWFFELNAFAFIAVEFI